MNPNQPPPPPPRSSNALPPLNDVADTSTFLDSIRTDISYSWNKIEYVIKFLTEALQGKTNEINALRKGLAGYETLLNEKSTRIMQLEQTLTRMQAQIQEIDYLNKVNESTLQDKDSLIGRLISWNEQTQAKITSQTESIQVLSTEKADLKTKLSKVEEQNRAVFQGCKLTEEQQKLLSAAVHKELSQRANLIHTKAKEVLMQHVTQYQQRIKELEDQLRVLKTKGGGEHDISENNATVTSVPGPSNGGPLQ